MDLAIAAVAPDRSDRWVGYMACFVDGPARVHLVSVYVAPEHRGSGLARRMVDEVCRWARDEAGADRVRLYVHEDNARARSFYRRYGFVETGGSMPYELDPAKLEIEMELRFG
jgi:ribosomal protein S18 acetylase RimI-like enzyme